MAFERYQQYIFFASSSSSRAPASSGSQLSVVSVSCGAATKLNLTMDESYVLSVLDNPSATITANTEWGCLRGLETFSQLVQWDYSTQTYFINNCPIDVRDSPRFQWRGLLIDTARHFLPLKTIYKAIDSLSFNKFNVLHWHMVDDQSFPFESQSLPLLSQKASWRPWAVYSHDDINNVITYAKYRGIRVVVEFDSPGHASCWGNGYPELFPPNCDIYPTIDPTQSYTWNFLETLFGEIGSVFEDEFIHLGGDEVDFTCWESDSSIAAWMKQNDISNYPSLQGYYEQQLQNILLKQGNIPVFWDEVFSEGAQFPLDTRSVIEVWNQPPSEVTKVVQAGYRALYASSWYLDQQIPNYNKTFYLWGDTWKDFYMADPIANQTLTPAELELVLGGEACMWGEQVDFTDFDVRVWPRAAAVAERLWSPQSYTRILEAEPRLGAQRCRMVQRGINAFPIYPDFCDTGIDGPMSLPLPLSLQQMQKIIF